MTNTPEAWSERAAAHENPWDAVGWSRNSQTKRFRAVLKHLDLRHDDTLLDFGCGTGEFAPWVEDSAFPVRYFGWDWAPGMVERARREHPHASFLDGWAYAYEFDHIVAIGVFNLHHNWSQLQTAETIDRLWRVTRRTLVVSLYRGDDEQCIHYTPSFLGGIVERSRPARFVIDASHLDNDVILRMSR